MQQVKKPQQIRTSPRCFRGGNAFEDASQDTSSESSKANNPSDPGRKALAFSRFHAKRLARKLAS
jgi:hypothetical protein